MPATPISASRPGAVSASLALAAALATLLLCAAGAAAAPPAYKGASADGRVVFFESEEQLVAGDTDNKRDVYQRSFDETVGAYVTREVSTGPTGGNDAYDALFEEASADGEVVFFSTEEPLTAADTDRETDVYARFTATGITKLVSAGAAGCTPTCGNGNFDTGFAGASGDGGEVFLVTAERLDLVADTDNSVDVYEHNLPNGPTTLVSAGDPACAPCGNGEFVATLRGVSADGSKAFFASSEPLVAADTDTVIDIYARDLPSGPTSLVSAGDPACAPCGNGGDAAIFAGSSTTGDKVFFASREKLVSSDNDGANDVYRRAGGVTTLVSGGTANQPANFAAVPGNGSRVFFVTAEPLAGGSDTNGANDVYMWQGGASQLITSGKCCGSTFAAVTADAGTVFFTTTESLSLEDGDSSADIYAQDVAGGPPVLISAGDPSCAPCGDAATAARFNRVSADGTRVLFTSAEQLSTEDFDNDDDIYARSVGDGETALSTPASGPCPTSECQATFVGASSDGDHVFFQTTEAMVLAEDPDSEPDIYERAYDTGLSAEVTRLVSTGNSAGLDLGPASPDLERMVPGPSGASTEPTIVGQAEAESSIKIYRTANCSGETVAAGTAGELADPGIAVKVKPESTSEFWATAEAEGFTSLCSNSVSYTQESVVPPPPPPPPSDGTGSGGGGAAATAPAGGAGGGPVKTHDGIAYVAPLTRITFGPAAKTRYPRPVFRFTDSTGQPGTRFSCRLDRGRWKPCGSPTKVARLRPGRHVFRVKAVNAVGVPETRPASRSFKVVAR
jgi:Tol biopolymer transport system component